MLIIEVISEPKKKTVETAEKTFELEYQHADLWVDDARPCPMEVMKPKKGPYAKGLYTLSGSSFSTNRYRRLEMQYANLVPLADALKAGELALKRAGKQ